VCCEGTQGWRVYKLPEGRRPHVAVALPYLEYSGTCHNSKKIPWLAQASDVLTFWGVSSEFCSPKSLEPRDLGCRADIH
jgi:hypothetical protein